MGNGNQRAPDERDAEDIEDNRREDRKGGVAAAGIPNGSIESDRKREENSRCKNSPPE